MLRFSVSTLLLFAFVVLFCIFGSVHSQQDYGLTEVDDEIAIPFKKGRPKGPLRFGKRSPMAPGGPLRFGKRRVGRGDPFQRYLQRVILPKLFEEDAEF
ncbi:hypothetical protein L596_018859 [Steinernema carpocapsae]|uniref:Uncharacterized protein n=1 Tax=Steinernema carpocapsae TaxID=34508 RepID=A0A4U5N5W8_STECR|nr:hypothetical protein L596_018859 [Steinernema carpocapsae]